MAGLTSYAEKDYPLALVHEYRIGTTSRIIYILVISSVLITLAALPFIYTGISVKGNGVLQAATGRSYLSSPVSGRIARILIRENQMVLKGDTLLLIDASLERDRMGLLQERYNDLNDFLADISQMMLCSEKPPVEHENLNLETSQYKASWRQFLADLLERRTVKEHAQRTLDRYTYLYQTKVISLSEFEKYSFENDNAHSGYSLLIKRYQSQWQSEALKYKEELRQLKVQRIELRQQHKLLTILAPFSGSIQNLAGIQTGTYVFANQQFAEISPATRLTAFCYVTPAHIGLIKVGQHVSFQIDAFNYNSWGSLPGRVLEISDDIVLAGNNQPVFKVRCSLDKDYLELNDRTKGHLKKGMNFIARFRVADRSLFQLLYDKTADWIAPDSQVKAK